MTHEYKYCSIMHWLINYVISGIIGVVMTKLFISVRVYLSETLLLSLDRILQCDLHDHEVTEPNCVKMCLNKLRKSTGVYSYHVKVVGGQITPNGMVLRIGSTWKECFVAYVSRNNDQHTEEMRIVGFSQTVKSFITPDDDSTCSADDKTYYVPTIANICSTYQWGALWTLTGKMNLTPDVLALWEDNSQQYDIYKDVCDASRARFRKGNGFVCMIHGPSGSGKSTVPMLVAREMQAKVCMNVNPTEPGVLIEELLTTMSPSQEEPAILVFEEADVWMIDAFLGKITPHQVAKASVKNKGENNAMFDLLAGLRGRYVIAFVLCNKSPDEIKASIGGDASPLRPGRINKIYHLYKSDRLLADIPIQP